MGYGQRKMFTLNEFGQKHRNFPARHGIHRDHVRVTGGATGHAIIQLDKKGGNCIIILAGANGEITEADVRRT